MPSIFTSATVCTVSLQWKRSRSDMTHSHAYREGLARCIVMSTPLYMRTLCLFLRYINRLSCRISDITRYIPSQHCKYFRITDFECLSYAIRQSWKMWSSEPEDGLRARMDVCKVLCLETSLYIISSIGIDEPIEYIKFQNMPRANIKTFCLVLHVGLVYRLRYHVTRGIKLHLWTTR